MPARTRQASDTSTTHSASTTTSTPGSASGGLGNSDVIAAMDTMTNGTEEEKEQVVVYLTQNSTTHHKDELPEALASLKHADSKGFGKKSLLPISDPYADGHETYQYAFGKDKAAEMQWWTGDDSLEQGQVRMGGEVLTLGAENAWGLGDADLQKISEDWKTCLVGVGLTPQKADEVIEALMRDPDGELKLTDSKVGATNELVQLISVLNRAENGEFDISSLVLSGHHYTGTDYLFGEKGDHEYDMADSLNLRDIAALSPVFPRAYAGVKSVQFSACNTYDLGIENEQGEDQSTNEFLQGAFPNIESAGYWEGIAPGPDMAAFFGGEFQLDQAKKESGDKTAFGDAMFRSTKKGTTKRSELGPDGKLTEKDDIKRNGSSYVYNDYKGMRNSNGEAFHKRADLMKYVHQKK